MVIRKHHFKIDKIVWFATMYTPLAEIYMLCENILEGTHPILYLDDLTSLYVFVSDWIPCCGIINNACQRMLAYLELMGFADTLESNVPKYLTGHNQTTNKHKYWKNQPEEYHTDGSK